MGNFSGLRIPHLVCNQKRDVRIRVIAIAKRVQARVGFPFLELLKKTNVNESLRGTRRAELA